MCQLTDWLTEEKYRGSLETVGKAILKYCANPGLEVLRFFEVNLFCFLTGNSDMHLKNFSLIRLIDGEVPFSPAYDLLPVALLLPEDAEETALTLHGKKKKLGSGRLPGVRRGVEPLERQMSNAVKRFEKALGAANALIDCGFCSEEIKGRYHKLLTERWQRLTG